MNKIKFSSYKHIIILSTIAGVLPLAIGLGTGCEVRAPMAIAVIGGLTTSTILTLFVVPATYTLFDDILNKLKQSKLK
jgi:HAE1 family hydrophobic/amphiphilic exporter-1